MIKRSKPMKGIPLVSVVLVGHNEQRYLKKEIASILNQDYEKVELILVDNCSSDKTYEIMEHYKRKNPNIKLLQVKGISKGPGNAWNLGAKNSKGEVLMCFGGDLVFGKDYISKMIQPILKGNTIGTIHHEEKIANPKNLWARGFCKTRPTLNPQGTSSTFSLIRKDAFFEFGPFDPSLGYSDDQTIYRKHGFEALGVNANVWHHNPDTFKKTWNHDVWIGRSFKHPEFVIIFSPFFPLWAFYKTLNHLKKDFFIPFFFFLPPFYILRYFAYILGATKRILEKWD